jgi:sialate O-acetylesterase
MLVMLWVAGWAVVAGADVRMSKLFTDHMVLQRDMDVPAWGWAEPNEKVTVQIAGQTVSATADAKGNWLVKLAALKAGGPYELVVTGKTALTLKDVLVGDVWVCAGQSNMEWPLVNTDTSKEAIAAATNSQIRLLSTKGPQTPEPEMTVPGPWAVCSPQTVVGFSAVGYHFGRILQEKVNIPIGLINIAWGGTAIELWLHPDSLAQVEELSGVRANYEKRMAEYQQQLDKSLEAMSQWVQEARESKAKGERIRPPKAEFPAHPAMGGIAGIYNGRVASLTSYGIKGAIWYQGESNGTENDLYYHKMRALVGGWRKVWNQGDFPFYFVQLANFTADNNIPAGGDGYA